MATRVRPASKTKPPADLLAALAKNAKAAKVYATLNKTNTFAISARVLDAKKPETRARRIAQFVAMLARGERFYP